MIGVDDEYFQFCVLKNTSSSMMYNIFYNEYSNIYDTGTWNV